jgi:hypothetical protein
MKNKTLKSFPEITEVVSPDKFKKIWEEVSLDVQKNKAKAHRLSEEMANQCFEELSRRPFYLAHLAQEMGAKNIAEVGTAQGLQYFSFAEAVRDSNGHVWSCDIKDDRNQEYVEKYKDDTTFCLGTSEVLATRLREDDVKIDMFYIDGAHGRGDVVKDVIRLREFQSDNPIWVFDDYDDRFGCYEDIKRLINNKKDVKIYRVGNAASGNPNHQVIVRGKY